MTYTQSARARLSLVNLPGMGPARLTWLLAAAEPPAVIEELRRGRLPADVGPAPPGVTGKMVEQWGKSLRTTPVDDLVAAHRSLAIGLLAPEDPGWPLAEDPEPPALLFYQGDLRLLELPVSVAVVGTRRCTTVGRTVAYRLGRDVGLAGGAVVSGLALGVDGAAHRGAIDHGGAAIGIVGSGLDVVYPGGNRGLWNDVAANGLLLSEAPAGKRPERWRFPARNRLIAGLSDGVVVVESHEQGGALLTIDEATDRGRPVFAVPGSVLSPASDGTNALLVDGASPVRNATDLFDHLGLAPPPTLPMPPPAADESTLDASSEPSELAMLIMAEAGTGPVHLDRLLLSSSSGAADVLAEVQSLVAAGRLVLDGSTVSLP